MSSTKTFFLLSLLYGISSAAWGPTDLSVDSGDTQGDFLNLNVQWKGGSCFFASYRVYSEAPGQGRKQEASTRKTKITITGKEFWTNYTISLETLNCFVKTPLMSQIYTGPGNPHKVTSVETEANALNASFAIKEAFMPRPVDLYDVTWCSFRGCKAKIFTRDKHGDGTIFPLEIQGLVPYTPYNLSVTPVIYFGNDTYQGLAYVTEFTTKDVHLPVPTNVKASTFKDDENHPEIKLTWELVECPYQLAFYNVTVKNNFDGTILESQSVNIPEMILIDMPDNAQLIANITSIYNISGALVYRNSALITFGTPHEEGFPWWIIVVVLIAIAAAAAAVGFVLYRRRKSKPEDTAHLNSADELQDE